MKLGNLLKKELRELLTKQAIFAMIFTCVLLICLGQFMGGVMDDAINNSQVNIADLDGSRFTADMITALPDYGADPEVVTLQSDDYFSELKRLGLDNLVIIPAGFGETVMNGGQASVNCVSLIDKGGLASSMKSISAASLTSSISAYTSKYIETEKMGLTDEQMQLISEPVLAVSYTAANGKTVEVSSEALSAMLMNQSMIAPFAVFFLVLMASQMIMTAISTEKIDKTLETLLSAPVSRFTVLMAKMIAALIVALLNAASMVVGFAFYMNGMMGSAVNEISSDASGGISMGDAMKTLGLTLSGGQMAIFAVQLFLTIAIGPYPRSNGHRYQVRPDTGASHYDDNHDTFLCHHVCGRKFPFSHSQDNSLHHSLYPHLYGYEQYAVRSYGTCLGRTYISAGVLCGMYVSGGEDIHHRPALYNEPARKVSGKGSQKEMIF